jgi:putative ABC transport system permease protein
MLLPGQSVEELARNPIVNMEVVSPSYFRVLGVPVLTGRAFNEGDRQGTTKVVVVSSATSRALWPGKDPIGERLGGKGEFTVVGVVPDTRYRDLVAARPSVYFPLAQPFFPMTPTTLVMRGDIAASQLRQAVAEVEGDVTVTSVATLGALLEGPRAQPRLNALVLGLFASAAIALAAIGVFSIMATMVRRRTREIGIRMALGATGGAVGRMVVFRGMLIATIGTVAGILAARAVSGMLSGLLFEIAATDVRTSIFVVTGVMTVTILACLVPARASAGVDPVKALRVEG